MSIDPILHPDTIQYLAKELEQLVTSGAQSAESRDRHLEDVRICTSAVVQIEARIADLRRILRHGDPENAERYAEHAGAGQVGERERRLADFRDLVAFWEANPQVPVPDYGTLHIGSSDGVALADVDTLAEAFGTQAEDSRNGYRGVQKKFGHTITLHVSVKIPPEPEPLPEAAEPPGVLSADDVVGIVNEEAAARAKSRAVSS